MTTIAPQLPAGRAASRDCLTAAPWAGSVIAVLFAVTVALFLIGLLTLTL